MRTPRKYTLPAFCLFHFIWRAINGEFFLADDFVKEVFLDRFFKFFKVAKGKVEVHSFVVMSNHFHMAGKLVGGHQPMSDWARSAHSSFALWLNRKLGRRGPVAQDRPKTLVAEDQGALKRKMFYHDWNPVRAGMCQHPSEYPFSSYRFYAFGEVNKWTGQLTPPQWYLALGDLPEQRQVGYREACDLYNAERMLPDDDFEQRADTGHATGSLAFETTRNTVMRRLANWLCRKTVPRKQIDGYFELALLSPHTVLPFCPDKGLRRGRQHLHPDPIPPPGQP
jgi:putative transposase